MTEAGLQINTGHWPYTEFHEYLLKIHFIILFLIIQSKKLHVAVSCIDKNNPLLFFIISMLLMGKNCCSSNNNIIGHVTKI